MDGEFSSHVMQSTMHYEDEEDELVEEGAGIEWSNLIFLPFHPIFEMVILFTVIVKVILGPLQSIHSVVYCSDIMDQGLILAMLKYFYMYVADILYATDTLLHMVHRQVEDKAMRREHLPKSAFLLFLDVLSIIPFVRLLATEECPPVMLFPNILSFSESIIVYRVFQYFSLVTTHCYWKNFIGLILFWILGLNLIVCFWILLTQHGLCRSCHESLYDWRYFVRDKLNETDQGFTTYVYATSYLITIIYNKALEDIRSSTILEFYTSIVFSWSGFILMLFVFIPKMFAECMLRLKRVFVYHPRVKRLVAETKRRNHISSYIAVKKFYTLVWRKRSGIVNMPDIVTSLPRYLKIDIQQDLTWPVFYHSPILRKTQMPFMRMLCERIVSDYKLPGETFFAGLHSITNLCYIKSGIVQIISADDTNTAILSLTSGTIFGDTSFIFPPRNRNVIVRCLTYCELLYVTRLNYLKTLCKYPEDRKMVISLAIERVKHAQLLYKCKLSVRGLDRTEDENLNWLRKRWWEISQTITIWRSKSHKKDDVLRCQLPPEDSNYHCAKYIGQLVLCHETKLQTDSLFSNTKFPWILVPHSTLIDVWNTIVKSTIVLVVVLYPLMLADPKRASWFGVIQFWTNLVYMGDICITLLTAFPGQEYQANKFASVMFQRCRSLSFFLDFLSTFWFESLVVIIGKPELSNIVQFNRLIKIYKLFLGHLAHWNLNARLVLRIFVRVTLIQFCTVYIPAYFIYMLVDFIPNLTVGFFFGPYFKNIHDDYKVLGAGIEFFMESIFIDKDPETLNDVYVGIVLSFLRFTTLMYCISVVISAFYLDLREQINYQEFVTKLKNYYKRNRIHKDLLIRLERYFICHWNYFRGDEIMNPNKIRKEPYDIFLKAQGELAEKIISESKPFVGANKTLVSEMAHAANFMLMPKNSTIFLFGVYCLHFSWVVQGHVKCEYHGDDGELVTAYYESGDLLAISSVFLGKTSLRTYVTYTDCELLNLDVQDFHKILTRYPKEQQMIKTVVEECLLAFEEHATKYTERHREYQKSLRDRVFHARALSSILLLKKPRTRIDLSFKDEMKNKVQSRILESWMIFRVIVVFISIISASLQGGYGAVMKRPLMVIGLLCDCIAWMDICLKMSLSYYNEDGIVIHDRRKCILHYVTRGFLLDLIGAIPSGTVLRLLMNTPIDQNNTMLINTLCKYAHLYLVIGFFNYLADKPTLDGAWIKIIKWQMILTMLIFGTSQYMMDQCVNFKFDDEENLVNMTLKSTCWMASMWQLSGYPSHNELLLLFVQSMNLAQISLLKLSYTRFSISRDTYVFPMFIIALGWLYWYIQCYSVTLIVLSSRGNVMFQRSVSQLKRFLESERVERPLLQKGLDHFTYRWLRTQGVNVQDNNKRIGVIFRQDLNYYFYEKTFTVLDTLLKGGISMGRRLASHCIQQYMLPGHDIIRQMDMTADIYIVHRGKVQITMNGKKICTLTRGCMFGQLDCTEEARPVHVTATAIKYVDLLHMNVKTFKELITDEVRQNIKDIPTSKFDYLITEEPVVESPYDTVQYIIKRRPAVKLPWMHEMHEACHGTWYYYWLYWLWFLAPTCTVFISFLLVALSPELRQRAYWVLSAFDLLRFTNVIMNFFQIKLVVVNDTCQSRIKGLSHFKDWTFHTDLMSLLIPCLTYFTDDWRFHLTRVVRLAYLHYFHVHFCSNFQARGAAIMLKIVITLLSLHIITCAWIYVSCRFEIFPLPIEKVSPVIEATRIDFDEWISTQDREGGGCYRMIRFKREGGNKDGFYSPKVYEQDYILALNYIALMVTRSPYTSTAPLTIKAVCFKIFINFLFQYLFLWMMSLGISYVYTKYRELYQHDFKVKNLLKFLERSGCSQIIMDMVAKYAELLWERHRGNWLPELVHTAPICLREDLFGSLYMYHLQTPHLFRSLPHFFLRQMATRLKRVVIFPGKFIVRDGDMSSSIYWIHEGEVERWGVNKAGECKMVSLLSISGYFGLIPGLFADVPFKFSYICRTVVDIIHLPLTAWQDLLDGYPDIKNQLYFEARRMKKEFGQ